MEPTNLPQDIKSHLTTLADIASILGIQDLHFGSYAPALDRLAAQKLSDERSLLRLQHLEKKLQAYLAEIALEDKLITQHLAKDDVEESTASLERRKHALLKQSVEYRKELESILEDTASQEIPVTFADVLDQQAANDQLRKELKVNRARIKAFQGLPPNKDLALLELKDKQDTLTRLTNIRERLLANMAKSIK